MMLVIAAARLCTKELEELSAENERLKGQVEALVQKLSEAEEANGGTWLLWI